MKDNRKRERNIRYQISLLEEERSKIASKIKKNEMINNMMYSDGNASTIDVNLNQIKDLCKVVEEINEKIRKFRQPGFQDHWFEEVSPPLLWVTPLYHKKNIQLPLFPTFHPCSVNNLCFNTIETVK